MNPVLQQIWFTAFEAMIKESLARSGEAAGYKSAKYADEVVKGVIKAAEEAKGEASKVVSLS